MLTDLQKQKLPRLFAVHDLNRDGLVTRADFEEYTARIASTRGWGTDSAEYKELLARFMDFWDGLEKLVQRKGKTSVTVSDWLEYFDRIINTPEMYDAIIPPIGRMIFTILDQDGDGSVTAEEYAATFKHGGLDAADAQPAFERLDLDHDGKLSIDEIIDLAHEFFMSDDPDAPGNALFGVLPVMAAH